MSGLARTVAAVLIVAAAGARAEPLDWATVTAPYRALQTYCDEVTVDHGKGGRPGSVYRRCFAADGRFKVHEFIKNYADSEFIQWGDKERVQTWRGHFKPWWGMVSDQYAEDENPRSHDWIYEMLNLFWINGFTGFEADPACEPGLRCYTRNMADDNGDIVGGDRLWLRHGDGFIVRFERHWNYGGSFSVVVGSIRLNAAEQLDFAHTAPLLARYSYSARPKTFLTGVLVACFAAGFLYWLRLDRRRLGTGIALPPLRRMWCIYLVVVSVFAVPLSALTVATWGVEGGHPPPIYFAILADVFVGFGLACLGALLAGIQLARKVALRRVSSAPSAPPA